jgi:NAD(P)H-hydrate epimerase
MYRADELAINGGISGLDLMEAAGAAIARLIRRRWRPRPVAILCGPGNNGGDGFVVARLLRREGWPVRVYLLGDPIKLRGDARINAERWSGDILSLNAVDFSHAPLVIDALFGAGLARPLDGAVASLIESINQAGLDCIGVDVPSGVHGDTGAILGIAPRCQATVTFFRPKPGHLLYPGRGLCGDLHVADIGIPDQVLEEIGPHIFENRPGLWGSALTWPDDVGNKYTRGHAIVCGGSEMTGAARLASEAARRQGAGLVTVVCESRAFPIYASGAAGTIIHPLAEGDTFDAFLADERRNALLIGPGAGVNSTTRRRVLAAAHSGKALVLDADALTVFADTPEALFSAIRSPTILTPHEGEFRRIFQSEGDKLTRARMASAQSGAIVILKGPDTVIAAPDGRLAVNTNAPPTLATAGSGDVLAGMCVGLLAQGVPAFEAACCAVWLHGQVAARFGLGMIAEDLIEGLPSALTALRHESNTLSATKVF